MTGLCAHQAHGFFLRSIQVLFTNGITELCPSAKLNRTHGWENKTFAVNGHLPPQWTPCIHLVGLLGCCLSVTWTLACWTLGNWCRPAPRARSIRRMGTYSSLVIHSLPSHSSDLWLAESFWMCCNTGKFFVQSETKSTEQKSSDPQPCPQLETWIAVS